MEKCEYCGGYNLGSKPISDQFDFSPCIESIVDGCFLYNICDSGHKTVLKINYCPMCGRKLE